MDAAQVVDAVVVLSLLMAAVSGWVRGLGRTAGGLVGAVGGAAVAVLVVVPSVTSSFVDHEVLLVASVAAFLLCVTLGGAIGTGVGGVIGDALRRLSLGWLDSFGGAVGGTLVAGVTWLLVAALVPMTGSATLVDGVGGSRTIQAMGRAVPPAVAEEGGLARLLERTEPWLADVAGTPATPPEIPDVDVDSAAVREASRSVVRVSGEAGDCHNVVSGSGFVVAPDRVMTNAHVVAGVDSPIVRAPGELPARGRVVHVDEVNDLAVVATDGLDAPALTVADSTPTGGESVIVGYPQGGPLTLSPARVLSDRRAVVTVGDGSAPRPVVTLAAAISPGNSGGPVIGTTGEVVGVVFAKGVTVEDVAYAAPASVAGPLADRAESLTDSVPTGTCRAG